MVALEEHLVSDVSSIKPLGTMSVCWTDRWKYFNFSWMESGEI